MTFNCTEVEEFFTTKSCDKLFTQSYKSMSPDDESRKQVQFDLNSLKLKNDFLGDVLF